MCVYAKAVGSPTVATCDHLDPQSGLHTAIWIALWTTRADRQLGLRRHLDPKTGDPASFPDWLGWVARRRVVPCDRFQATGARRQVPIILNSTFENDRNPREPFNGTASTGSCHSRPCDGCHARKFPKNRQSCISICIYKAISAQASLYLRAQCH